MNTLKIFSSKTHLHLPRATLMCFHSQPSSCTFAPFPLSVLFLVNLICLKPLICLWENDEDERKRESTDQAQNITIIFILWIFTAIQQSESNYLRITPPFKTPLLTTSLISSSVHLSLAKCISEGLLTSSLQHKYSVTVDKHTLSQSST